VREVHELKASQSKGLKQNMTPAQVLAFVYSQPPSKRWRMALLTQTEGSTPRSAGALLALANDGCCVGSIGGGAAEAETLRRMRFDLADADMPEALTLDLRGGAQALGICGGSMQVQLRAVSPAQLMLAAQALHNGLPVPVAELGFAAAALHIAPAPQLLMVGAGHCGAALAQIAYGLGYALLCVDDRAPEFAETLPPSCHYSNDISESLRGLRPYPADVVLLTRNDQQDIAALHALYAWAGAAAQWRQAFGYFGMMGSARRIRAVAAALPFSIAEIDAPVGLNIGAQTPAEIAISIAAALIARRANHASSRSAPSL
jgi:xanthine dehydrogenase accessory factor